MSHFYGVVSGQAKTDATRTGSKKSGLATRCASWNGSIGCRIDDINEDEPDRVLVSFELWHGAGLDLCLYDGPVGEFKPEKGLESVSRHLVELIDAFNHLYTANTADALKRSIALHEMVQKAEKFIGREKQDSPD